MRRWRVKGKTIDVSRNDLVMGIVNVTPDSFSDGGRYDSVDRAVEHALALVADGAAIVDIGGESTRPGAQEIPIDLELARVLPVVEGVRRKSEVLISIDTRKPEVAREALQAGADIVNDIEAARREGMAEICAEFGCGLVAMHMQGEPATMQETPQYTDVVAEVRTFFEERYNSLTQAGVHPEQICWDPGIGFGKTLEHNLALVAHLEDIRVHNLPMLLALSRKRMISTILGSQERGYLPHGTAALSLYGRRQGAQIHRVHDVRECVECFRLVQAVESFE